MALDLGPAWRGMRARPLATAVVVLALGLGMGFTTAVFSLVNAWLLRALPFAAPDRLVHVWEDDVDSPQRFGLGSDAVFDLLTREARSFELLAAQRSRGATPTALRIPSPLVHEVSASYFSVLGAKPRLGRLFTAEEYQPGTRRVILAHGFWQRYLGSDPGIVGRTLELDFAPYEVVGILAPDFHGPIQREPPQLFLPLALAQERLDFGPRRMFVFGRLAPATELSAAQAELDAITAEVRARQPQTHSGRRLRVERVQEILVQPVRLALWTLFAAVAAVLLIACCNVANLLLARALTRQREMAVRAALGAGPAALLRQLIGENLVLAAAGGLCGLALAVWTLRVLQAMIPPEPGLPWLELVRVDGSVLLFAALLTAAIGVAFGWLQAQHSCAADFAEVLQKTGCRTTAGRGFLRGTLVVLETGFSLILLIAAGLMIQSYVHTQGQDPGFASENILTLRTAVRGPNYAQESQRAAFFDKTLTALRALPGAATAAIITRPPPDLPLETVPFRVVGIPAESGHEPRAVVWTISPDLFTALSIPVLSGRAFTPEDNAVGDAVAIVSQGLQERFLADRDPKGQVIQVGADSRVRRIVGVVGDVRTAAQPPDPAPTLYLPHAQQADAVMSYVIHTRSNATALTGEVLRVITDQDPLLPIYRVTTLEETLKSVDWQPRFSMRLLAFLAVVALFLAVTGIYAVMAWNVAERRRELVIRTALGARPAVVLRWVLTRAALWVAIGLGGGVIAALALAQLLASELHGVKSSDPKTYLALVTLFALVALTAGLVVARRALTLDPARVLREE